MVYCDTIRITGTPRRPLARSRRQPNKVSHRRSNSGKDLLRIRNVVCQETLGSPVRRSQRLAGRRTPVGVSKIDAKVNCSGYIVLGRLIMTATSRTKSIKK